ncbi:MAG: hypothetical protein AAFY29_22880 [Pseudomonadota bacterium]
MTAVQASWIPPNDRTKRCVAIRQDKYNTDVPGQRYRCKNRACIELNGMAFCARHGGAMALRLLAGPEPAFLPQLEPENAQEQAA